MSIMNVWRSCASIRCATMSVCGSRSFNMSGYFSLHSNYQSFSSSSRREALCLSPDSRIMPSKVRLVEVGPRDGLQNEETIISTRDKIEFINLLGAAGLQSIEVAAFVSPKRIPQMADAAEVFKGVYKLDDVTYPVLVPNMQGYEAAVSAGAKEVAVFASASETFSLNNINCSIKESFERFEPIFTSACKDGIRVRGYVSCVLGCPYEGEISPLVVADISSRLRDAGCYEISLGDTIGTGTPNITKRMLNAVLDKMHVSSVAVHFHDSYGQALSNVLVALNMGVSVIDCSVAGLGGCPFAHGATGNLATEDVLYMLCGMDIETGVSMERLLRATIHIGKALDDRPPASRVANAMLGSHFDTSE